MAAEGQVWDDIYNDYLKQLGDLDLSLLAKPLGVVPDGDAVFIDMFNKRFRVGHGGIADENGRRPIHAISVILAKYLLVGQYATPGDGSWKAYKEFKDCMPYVQGFDDTAHKPVERSFGGELQALESAADKLGGVEPDEGLSYDFVRVFHALPKVPILMLFNDSEDMFPAQCSMLFRADVLRYLDTECTAICGGVLASWLQRAAGK